MDGDADQAVTFKHFIGDMPKVFVSLYQPLPGRTPRRGRYTSRQQVLQPPVQALRQVFLDLDQRPLDGTLEALHAR